jgi:DNA-binding MarR family transcriptional regulator
VSSTDEVAMPFLLMSAFEGLADAVHRELERAGYPGVRTTHGFAMQAIGSGCTSVELGARLGISKQAAAKTAQSLEELGFITRTRGPHDRRERILQPTPRGLEMLRLSALAFRREVEDWRRRAGDEVIDATLDALLVAPRPTRRVADFPVTDD